MVGIVLLASGLGVWGIVADRHHPPHANSRLFSTRDEGPPEVRELLERARLDSAPAVLLFDRASIPMYGIVVPGGDAIEISDRLRHTEHASHTPLVLGDGWDVRAHEDAAKATIDSPHAIIERARAFDLDAWIARRLEEVARELRTDISETWTPHGQEHERFRLIRDSALDVPRPSLVIALIPTRASAESPAWLAFGNWRGCPEPTVHVAMLAR